MEKKERGGTEQMHEFEREKVRLSEIGKENE